MEVGVKMNKKKIVLYILIIILVIGILVGFIYTNKKDDKTKENKVTDAIKIKEEYESLNDKQASNGNIYPKVTLKENNTFRYASAKKVLETLKSGTGLIYLGFKECPWCRNAINVLQYVNANEILYLDMTNQRDKYEEKDGKAVKTEEGTEEYKKMLTILDSILDNYEIEDENGNTINIGEKRIYVPLVIGIKDGKIVGYHADTVKLDDNQSPYDLLTNKQQNDLKLIYDEINAKVSGDSCDLDVDHGC